MLSFIELAIAVEPPAADHFKRVGCLAPPGFGMSPVAKMLRDNWDGFFSFCA